MNLACGSSPGAWPTGRLRRRRLLRDHLLDGPQQAQQLPWVGPGQQRDAEHHHEADAAEAARSATGHPHAAAVLDVAAAFTAFPAHATLRPEFRLKRGRDHRPRRSYISDNGRRGRIAEVLCPIAGVVGAPGELTRAAGGG